MCESEKVGEREREKENVRQRARGMCVCDAVALLPVVRA